MPVLAVPGFAVVSMSQWRGLPGLCMRGRHVSDYDAALIICDPEINGGEPTVRGTRVTVRTILASLDEDCLSDHSFFPSKLKGVTW